MRNLFFILMLLLSVPGIADDTYTNPVLASKAPDPTIIRAADGYFYLIATDNLPPVYKSSDLVNWSFVRRTFSQDGRPSWEPNAGIWAPDINYINGKYVLYYSMSVWGGVETCGIGIAVSDKPEGPYTDLGKLFRSNEIGVTNSIDPNYYEENGKKYLIWGSLGGGIWVIELNDDGLSLKEGSEKVQIAGTSFEGAYIHKRGGYYYLFASAGSCCNGVNSTYRLVVGRSTSLKGTYLNKDGQRMLDNKYALVITSNTQFKGTGHCSEIVTDDAGSNWIFYHAYQASNPETGRVLLLSRIKWDEAGWPYVDNNTPALSAPKPVFRYTCFSK
ncbi:MAG: family 43 glycosylhydrolase [Candidatus Symbiothrix sp.]|nr:family 43 glycosylhydrolase [Candidatus Symbiothrix sp.]